MRNFLLVIIVFLISSSLFANGLMIPKNNSYPKDFLRNTVTKINISIHGHVAETKVYQEFLNEDYDSVDAVYSFPLPPNAKATDFVYWYRDTVYQAVLKVKEQAVNPGTGEGGVIAEVNEYLGRNGIKIFLKGIQPGEVQKVELSYISNLEYFNGEFNYRFPLDSRNFSNYQLENFEINFDIDNTQEIISYDIPSHPEYRIISENSNSIQLSANYSKIFVNGDLFFNYKIELENEGLDFYSSIDDSSKGHFALFYRPTSLTTTDQILPKRIIFLISNSNRLSPIQLNKSVEAVKYSISNLAKSDQFNIILYNRNSRVWQRECVVANESNKNLATQHLENIAVSYGSDMDEAIQLGLEQIKDSDYSNSILLFGDGFGLVDPQSLSSKNNYRCGIFPIAIGSEFSYERLEYIASENYGFVTYLDKSENISETLNKVYDKISRPIMLDVAMEYGNAGVENLLPSKSSSLFAGSYFVSYGKYENPGQSVYSIAGLTNSGMHSKDFNLTYNDNNKNSFVSSLWAKSMIDHLEQKIEVYGEIDNFKERLIEISLEHNIRCRYTAYIADYETPVTAIQIDEKINSIPESYLIQNYPNPFNPTTTINFHLNNNSVGKIKLLKIYNILGELVAVIDLTSFGSGWNNVTFNGVDMFGNQLPSGIYIAQLQVGNKTKNTLKMSLLK